MVESYSQFPTNGIPGCAHSISKGCHNCFKSFEAIVQYCRNSGEVLHKSFWFWGRLWNAGEGNYQHWAGLTKANSWHMLFAVAFALAKENETFIRRMIELGRFNNQS